MRTLIVPLSKSPHPKGRVGKMQDQDWYKTCVRAVECIRGHDSKIYVISAFQAQGSLSEANIFLLTLTQLGIDPQDIVVIREETETIGQIEHALRLSKEHTCPLVLICTFFHAPRVWWLARREKHVHIEVVWGIPRPSEVITDVVLALLFPIIDICGGRAWFQSRVMQRRNTGKL